MDDAIASAEIKTAYNKLGKIEGSTTGILEHGMMVELLRKRERSCLLFKEEERVNENGKVKNTRMEDKKSARS